MTVIKEDEEFLEHFGVKGMQWGVRSNRPAGVTRSTNRMAKKDAKEFATAKMFYGEGAGTRRKLIKATVEQRSKNDPSYKKAFDHHLGNQDMAARASAATKQRGRKDTATKTKQRAGYLARTFTGQMGTQAAFMAAALAGTQYLRSPSGQAQMRRAKNSIVKTVNSPSTKNFFKQFGITI
jgi:hypothetical protein